jgi:FkbM family methyltransferase
MTTADPDNFGTLTPGSFDRAILAMTTRLPENWLGLRLAILLRRAVTMRLDYPAGALDVERWGMRLRLHPRDNGCEKNLLFTPRMYEPIELSALAVDIAKAKDEGRTFSFVDIGANVGLFSLFVAARAGGNARILAIEPEPGNLRRLHFNVLANPSAPIKIVATALSDEAGDLVMKIDRRDRGGSRITRKVATAPPADEISVSSRTLLDTLTAEGVQVVDALKIDVEGFEDVILHPFFATAPPELWPRLIVIEDSRPSWKFDLMGMLSAKGYSMTGRSKQNLILRRDSAQSPVPNEDGP